MSRADGSAAKTNEAGGFRVTSLPTQLRVVTWGYWPPDVAAGFSREVAAIVQKLTPAVELVVDAEELKPQGTEGQGALRLLLRSLAATNFAKGTVIAHNVLTRMQLARLLRECGLDGRIEFGDSLP